MPGKKSMQLRVSAMAGVLLFCLSPVMADEAEDNSAAFEADKETLGATLGVPDAEATVTTDENGMTSAVVGLSALKMLVVRQNSDGTLSYGHASSDAEAETFVESTDSNKTAEE